MINIEAIADDIIRRLRTGFPTVLATVIAATNTGVPVGPPSASSYLLGEWSRYRPLQLPAVLIVASRSLRTPPGENVERWSHELLLHFVVEGQTEPELLRACERMAEACYACLHDQDVTAPATDRSAKVFVESVDYGPVVSPVDRAASFRKHILLTLAVRHFDRMTMAPLAITEEVAVALLVYENGVLTVTGADALNFIDPNVAALVTQSPTGQANITLSGYALLSGRPGGQTVYGGTNPGDAIVLQGTTSSATDATKIFLGQTATGEAAVNIGGSIDPLEVAFGFRLFQFLSESDGGLVGGALFGAWTASDAIATPGGQSSFIFLASRGSRAAPANTQDGDFLALLQAQGWPINQPAAQISIRQDGTTGSQVPGEFRVAVADDTHLRNIFAIRSNGLIMIGDTLVDTVRDASDVARFHVRTEASGIVGRVVQAHVGQTANLDEWWPGLETVLAADANVSDTTLTLADSSKMASAGFVTIQGQDGYQYSANNTGTGVLTLVGTVTVHRSSGASVRGLQAATPLAAVLPNGAFRLAHLADTDAANDTWYYSLTVSGAVYKDAAGVAHKLY